MRIRAPVAGPQQLGDLCEAAPLDKLADRIAAVQQTAVRAIDHRQRGLAGHDALEARRIGAIGWLWHRPRV